MDSSGDNWQVFSLFTSQTFGAIYVSYSFLSSLTTSDSVFDIFLHHRNLISLYDILNSLVLWCQCNRTVISMIQRGMIYIY
jgi:hypothetical protein